MLGFLKDSIVITPPDLLITLIVPGGLSVSDCGESSLVIQTSSLARATNYSASLGPGSDSGVSSGQSTATVPWEAECDHQCDHQDCQCEQETIVI